MEESARSLDGEEKDELKLHSTSDAVMERNEKTSNTVTCKTPSKYRLFFKYR